MRNIAFIFALYACAGLTQARAECNHPTETPTFHVPVDGHPFAAIPTADGCTIFTSLTAEHTSKIAILKRDAGIVTTTHAVDVAGSVTGMALSPDGRFLAAANGTGVALFDATVLASRNISPLALLDDGPHAGSIYVTFSPDGKLLVVANERSASLTIYDVSALPKSPKFLAQLPTGNAPVGLAFTVDGKTLYSTSESGPQTWPARCQSEGLPHPEGALLIYNISRTEADPKVSLVGGVAAGCNAVRVSLSADGNTAYVTARGENRLEIFDTKKLVTDPEHSLLTTVAVGSSPVGVTTSGGKIFVTNSNRFGGTANQSVSVLDQRDPHLPPKSLPAGGFPRELKVTSDGGTLLITNFYTQTLELVDLNRW